jgi:hypothetical protein
MSTHTRLHPPVTRDLPVYRVLCLSGCGEHMTTNDDDAAWDEAAAHERALGHGTRVTIEEGWK